MKYLKVFTDFAISIAALDDAERGRLFGAMLSYAECGKEPVLLGNERFVWGIAKLQIDRERDCYDRKVASLDHARKHNAPKRKAKPEPEKAASAPPAEPTARSEQEDARRDAIANTFFLASERMRLQALRQNNS